MTANGELYVDETCRDVFTKDLNKAFGKDKWRLDGSNYGHIWSDSEIPPIMRFDILDSETDEIIGEAEVENKYHQEYDAHNDCMYLEPYPYKIQITKGKEGNNE